VIRQPSFFDEPSKLEREFMVFHEANPQVFSSLVKGARALRRVGHKHFGIARLYEGLRFQHAMKTVSEDQYKLNNNHRAFYARKIMAECPDLVGFFETRVQKA